MKVFRLAILGLLMSVFLGINAQDIITLKNGEEIKAKVTEISSSEIKYKRFENLDGPVVVIPKGNVFAINYENGTREIINVTTTESSATVKIENKETQRTIARPSPGIYVNPVGFLTFGPMIGIEFTGGKFNADLSFRFPSAGLLMPWMEDWEYGDDVTIKDALGVGISLKYYANRPKGGFYVGGFIEYSFYKAQYFDGYGKYTGVAIGSNIGHKFVFPSSGIYLRLGGYLGAAVETNYDWYPNNGYGYNNSGDITAFIMLDFAIGVKFLK